MGTVVKAAWGIALILWGFGTVSGQVPEFVPSTTAGISAINEISNFYGHGASAADYDNDGDIDFFLGTTSAINDRLYRNNGDGTFTDVAVSLGFSKKESTRMTLWMDYNGDGLLDLVSLVERCANFKCGQPILIYLYEQQNDGTFTERGAEAGLLFGDKYDNLEVYSVGGMAAGDLNNDDYLDLIVTVWGGQITVFMNNGDGTFSDESLSTSLGEERNFYWQPMIHDFNHDGWMDVMCNVDFGPNEFWKNDANGRFTEIAKQIGAAVDHSEMGMTLGDFDNDGDLDMYSTNITRMFQGAQEHNVLLVNDSEAGFLVFNERAQAFGVGMSGWDWGTTFMDMNNDGWLDLVSTNGWNNDPDWGPDQSSAWLNTQGNFTDVTLQTGFSDELSATSLISFDMDRDGDLDLLQTLKDNEESDMPAVLYENKLEETVVDNNFVVVKPRMNGTNVFAIGSIVRISAGGQQGMRLISAGTSFFAQEPAEAFFGVGENELVEEIRVEWPDGKTSVYENIDANQVITLNYEVIDAPEIQNVMATSEGIVIEWADRSDNESGFTLQRSDDKDFETFISFSVTADQTSYVDAEASGTHWYRIKAFNDNVASVFSEAVLASQVTAISNVVTEEHILIYPNPVSDYVQISVKNDYFGPAEISIIDQHGKLLYSMPHVKDQESFTLYQDLNLASGLYLIQLQMGDQYIQRKLVVMR